MAGIQQEQMNILREALKNVNAYGDLRLVHPVRRPADPTADQEVANNAERLREGMTPDGERVLHIAARLEDVELVRAIISERWGDVLDVTAKNERGETALHCAAATGNADMISALLTLLAEDGDKKRQFLRGQNDTGETCLHEAARCGKKLAVERLVQEDVSVVLEPTDGGALVKICDVHGVSPLFLATTLRLFEIVHFLTEQQGAAGTYPAASYDGPGSKTALHAAVLLDKKLSQRLANWKNELIDRPDEYGTTPLHLLASTKEQKIMKLFLDADPCAGYRGDNKGSLPIHVAAANGSLEMVKLLSDRRPSCSWSRNNFGQTILHIAVQNGSSNVVKYVCSRQSFTGILNTRDKDGNTALHLAVREADQFIFCRLMRKKEVSLSITNKEEHTPLDLAQMSLPQGTILQAHRHWIMYAMVLAGADYGTCRSNHLDTRSDKEKEEESIGNGKSAGLLAVCSVLIMTTAFAAPFSVTKLYHDQKKDKDDDMSMAFAYRTFVISDALAFAFSALTISFSTLAGFPFMDRGTRLLYLVAGVAILFLASMAIVVAFMSGLYVAVAPEVNTGTILSVCLVIAIVFPIIVLPLTLVFRMVIHAWSLLSRLGILSCSRRMICCLPRQRRDRVPIRYRGLCITSLLMVFLTLGVSGLVLMFTLLSRRVIKVT